MLRSRLTIGARAMLAAVLLLSASGLSYGAEDMVKKTLDGRCLAPDHPDYWKTKVYVAKPSMEACIKSGGRRG